ncbi:hypothetical protein J7E32_14850 [Bacillus sp. ISL-55]|nr:hypothetical protein [Bacillus sp. ISL-55]
MVLLWGKPRGQAGVLSESGVTSDKTTRTGRDFVRSWCDFGQNGEEKLRFCLKMV